MRSHAHPEHTVPLSTPRLYTFTQPGHSLWGLGISGDTPCADHEIAKRIRHLARLDPAKGPTADDIQFAKVDRPSIYTHPLCPNTWRNGTRIGDEQPASGY